MLSKVTQIVVLAMVSAVLLTEASFDDDDDDNDDDGLDLFSRGMRALGGWNKMNITDAKVQSLAIEAAAHLESVRNSGKVYQIQDVISAKYQMVRGKNYLLALTIGETDCTREPNVNVEDCTVVKLEQCLVIVWVWQDKSDFVNFTCRAKPRPMPGGIQRADVDGESIQQAAAFAATELTSRSNGLYQVQHQCITKATSQVVAGALYRMTLVMSVTSNNSDKSKTAKCTVAVSDQAWMTPRYKLVEYKCNHLIS